MLYTNRSRVGKLTLWLPLFVLAGWPTPVQGANRTTSNVMPSAIRSSDRALNELLAEGYTRSTTFQRLVDSISMTNTLVYVEAGVCAFGHVNACLLPFMATTDKGRYLRVVITQPLNLAKRDRLIALIGHELQHALEVAERPEVIDVTSMIAMYRRIGFPLKGRAGYETSAARAAGTAIFEELRKTNRAPCTRATTVHPRATGGTDCAPQKSHAHRSSVIVPARPGRVGCGSMAPR